MTSTIITPIPDLKVPSSHFYWIGRDSWPPSAHQYYHDSMLSLSSLTIMKRPPIYKLRSRGKEEQVHEFVLKGEKRLEASCEIQIFGGKIRQGIFFSKFENPLADYKYRAVGLLITAAIICYEIDIIKVVDETTLFSVGECKSLLTFHRSRHEAVRKPYLQASRDQWMEKFQGEDFVKTLHFLQIRKIRRDKAHKKNPPKRGLLARLFRPRIEDSIF